MNVSDLLAALLVTSWTERAQKAAKNGVFGVSLLFGQPDPGIPRNLLNLEDDVIRRILPYARAYVCISLNHEPADTGVGCVMFCQHLSFPTFLSWVWRAFSLFVSSQTRASNQGGQGKLRGSSVQRERRGRLSLPPPNKRIALSPSTNSTQ